MFFERGRTMYKLWKMNTITFVLQLLIATALWIATDGFGDFWLCGLAFSYFIIAGIAIFTNHDTVFGEFASAAIAMVLVGLIDGFSSSIPIAALILGFLITMNVVADSARIEGAKENFWLLFMVALPFGIGTIIGGALLFGPSRLKKVATDHTDK